MIRFLLEGLLASALLAAIVWTVCLLGRRARLGPAACHTLWLAVLVKLLLPPLFAWPWALGGTPGPSPDHAAPAGIVQQARWWLFPDQDRPRPAQAGAAAAGDSPAVGVVPAARAPSASAPAAPTAPPVSDSPQLWLTPAHLRAALLALWLTGGTSFLLVQISRTLRLRHLLGHAAPDPHLTSQVAAIAGELRLAPPRALRVPNIDGPYVWALFRPLLLWPADMDCRTTDARGLLAHELAHLRRRDHWIGWLVLLAGTLWWWNPVYWLVRRQLHRNAELCCDAHGVRILQGARRAYASALLDVSQRAVARRAPALALGVRATRAELEGRLTMIMTGNPTLRSSIAAWALALALLGLALPAWSQATSRPKLPFTISKETTVITEPLLPDGAPDYVAAINEKYGQGVTPDNNGFVAWLKVIGTENGVFAAKAKARILKMSGAQETAPGAANWESFTEFLMKDKGLAGEALDKASNDLTEAELAEWSETQRPQLAEFLQSHEKQLDLVAEAAARPRWWVPAVAFDGRTLVSVSLPSLGFLREMAFELCARATLRGAKGDINGWLADVVAAKRFARQLGGGKSLIERLVAVSMDNSASQALGTVIGSGKLTAPQCQDVANAMKQFAPLPAMAQAIDTAERWNLLDVVVLAAMGQADILEAGILDTDGSESKNPILSVKALGTIERDAVDWDAVFKMVNALFDEQVRIAEIANLKEMRAGANALDQRVGDWAAAVKASGRQDLRRQAGETRAAYTELVGHVILVSWLPSLGKAEEIRLRGEMTQAMAQVELAAAKMKAKSGAWPVKAEDLVPDYLPELPRDMYSMDGQEPLKYVVTDKGPRVYSVGENGRDDGGHRGEDGKDDIGVGPG